MSQSADTADADADAGPHTIVIEQCKVNLIVGVLILNVAYL